MMLSITRWELSLSPVVVCSEFLYSGDMKTATLTFKIMIAADQHVIFDYLSDWQKQSDWILFTTVEKVSAEPDGTGTKLLAKTGYGPLTFIDTMLVTEWLPPASITVEHTGRVILGKGVFTIRTVTEHSCEFIWQEITPVPFGLVGRIGLIIVKPFLNIMFGTSLKKLKTTIETATNLAI